VGQETRISTYLIAQGETVWACVSMGPKILEVLGQCPLKYERARLPRHKQVENYRGQT